jgi:hypothetical protein
MESCSNPQKIVYDERCVNIVKESEVENKSEINNTNLQKTFQMSYYVCIQWCNDLRIRKVQQGENK